MIDNNKLITKQNNFLSRLEKYIENNKESISESTLVGVYGSRIEDFDLSTQERFIQILCENNLPIAAIKSIRSFHQSGTSVLENILIKNLNSFQWTLFDKIVTLIYLDQYDILVNLFNEEDDPSILNQGIKETLKFFVYQSDYEAIFRLFYVVTISRHHGVLFYPFMRVKTSETSMGEESRILLKKGMQILYEKKSYDPVFYLCKNFGLLQYLKEILDREPEKLEKEFLALNTINGVRLAFRVIQNDLKNDRKAYTSILSQIKKMDKNDEIQYIHFCYILKLIELQGNIDSDLKEQLLNLGKVDLLESRIYGINLLAETLESILTNEGLGVYEDFISLLGPNNIFAYKKKVPEISPFIIYKNVPLESIASRKELLNKIIDDKNLNEHSIFSFYMNSYFKYYLTLEDLFSIMYKDKEDRVPLKRKFDKFVFFGKVSTIKKEGGSAKAWFQNVANIKHPIWLYKKNIGQAYFDLLNVGDEFRCKLERYNPINGIIEIDGFKPIGDESNIEYMKLTDSYWNALKKSFKEIISSKGITPDIIEEIKSIPFIDFRAIDKVRDYVLVYSDVLLSLRDNSLGIINFIQSLSEQNNNLFNITDTNSNFLPFSRIDPVLLKKANNTIKSLLDLHLDRQDLIFIYLNSYLRFCINIQVILDSFLEKKGDKQYLSDIFYPYRFYGELSNVAVNKRGKKLGYIKPISVKSSRSMSFFLDRETNVTDDMFNLNEKGKTAMITFRLKEYLSESEFVSIEDIWTQTEKNWIRNWKDMHDCHKQIKFTGNIKKETLDELRNLSVLKIKRLDFNRFVEDFIWCMNNLCTTKDSLFSYINALHKNNPYEYFGEGHKNVTLENSSDYNIDQSRRILNHLIENDYNLYKILWILLNSYLRNHITVEFVLKEYFYKKTNGYPDLLYLTEIKNLIFGARVGEIRDGIVVLEFIHVKSDCELYLNLDEIGLDEEDFSIGQKYRITLNKYDQKNNRIGALLC